MNINDILNNKAIQCDTEKKARTLLTVLGKHGYNWKHGDVTQWNYYEDETCYFIKSKEIMFHARAALQNLPCYRGTYEIVSFDNIISDIEEVQTVTLTLEQFTTAKKLAYANGENPESEIGFEFNGLWITNPFVEPSSRFEFVNAAAMCKYYGQENIYGFLEKLFAHQHQEKEYKAYLDTQSECYGCNGIRCGSCLDFDCYDEEEHPSYENIYENGSVKHKLPTNSAQIRLLSDEELAKFLVLFHNTFGEEYEGEMSCLDWLKKRSNNVFNALCEAKQCRTTNNDLAH